MRLWAKVEEVAGWVLKCRVGALRGRVRRERWREKKGGEATGTSIGEMLLASTGKPQKGREGAGTWEGRGWESQERGSQP